MIYRVIVKTTGSLQPCGTFWCAKTIHCGTDLEAARAAYLASEVEDRGGSYGNPASRTVIEEHESTPDDITTTDGVEISCGEEV